MIVSNINDGNMHPNLSNPECLAQQNFDKFYKDMNIDMSQAVGLRIDPKWHDGARIVDDVDIEQFGNGSVACEKRISAHGIVIARNIGAFILSADCFPVVITATEHKAITHIGWRSVEDNLIGYLTNVLKGIGYSPNSLSVEVGPGISAESYIVNRKKVHQLLGKNAIFWSNHIYNNCESENVNINLRSAIKQQLRSCGVNVSKTEFDPRDTYTDTNLYSRRASFEIGKRRGNHTCLIPADR